MDLIRIYTLRGCGYARRAKELLDRKGIPYEEIDFTDDPETKRELGALTGGKTSSPQVFIHGRPVGGSDDLHALAESGELDQIIGASGSAATM